jgi:lysophospholipase L1-like esterase
VILLAATAQADKILVIGDSISVRWDGSQADDLLSWSYLLEQANPEHEWVHLAVPGTTTRDWTNSAGEARYAPHGDADLVLLLLGANDAPSGILAQEYALRMHFIASHFEPERVWVSLPYDSIGPNDDATANGLMADYRDAIVQEADVAWQLGAALAFMSDPDLLIFDGVHPSQEGHDRMAVAIADRVPALVPEPSTHLLLAIGLAGMAILRPRSRHPLARGEEKTRERPPF